MSERLLEFCNQQINQIYIFESFCIQFESTSKQEESEEFTRRVSSKKFSFYQESINCDFGTSE